MNEQSPKHSITHLVDTLGNVMQEVGYSSWEELHGPEMDTLYRYDNQLFK